MSYRCFQKMTCDYSCRQTVKTLLLCFILRGLVLGINRLFKLTVCDCQTDVPATLTNPPRTHQLRAPQDKPKDTKVV